MQLCERRAVVDYIWDPDWEDIAEEAATNTIVYRHLIESKQLDPSKESHVLLVHGKRVRYGKEISWEEDEELEKQYPGKFYALLVQKVIFVHGPIGFPTMTP